MSVAKACEARPRASGSGHPACPGLPFPPGSDPPSAPADMRWPVRLVFAAAAMRRGALRRSRHSLTALPLLAPVEREDPSAVARYPDVDTWMQLQMHMHVGHGHECIRGVSETLGRTANASARESSHACVDPLHAFTHGGKTRLIRVNCPAASAQQSTQGRFARASPLKRSWLSLASTYYVYIYIYNVFT